MTYREFTRREFLKVSAATTLLVLSEGYLNNRRTHASNSLSIKPVEKLKVTVVTDNYYDALRWNLHPPDFKMVKRFSTLPGRSIHAEHGLSYYIEASLEGRSYGVMFDYGLEFRGVARNISLLGIDFAKIDALGLSHGHFDHYGNLVQLLKHNRRKIKKGVPLFVGVEAFERRYVNLPEGRYEPSGLQDLGQLSKKEIESLNLVRIVEVKDPTEMVPGIYISGNIERVTEYEKGSPILLIKRGEKLEQDLFPGEQALFFNVKDRGLVVISSCAHAGIVNTVKHVQKISGIGKIHAIIGGFHLIGAPAEKVQRTVADIKSMEPDFIIPMHCTGWEAITTFEKEMPKQFILNTAGTTYLFGS